MLWVLPHHLQELETGVQSRPKSRGELPPMDGAVFQEDFDVLENLRSPKHTSGSKKTVQIRTPQEETPKYTLWQVGPEKAKPETAEFKNNPHIHGEQYLQGGGPSSASPSMPETGEPKKSPHIQGDDYLHSGGPSGHGREDATRQHIHQEVTKILRRVSQSGDGHESHS